MSGQSPASRTLSSWWWLWLPVAVPFALTAAWVSCTPDLHEWLWSEQGLLEASHVLIPLGVMACGLVTLGTRGRLSRAMQAGESRLVLALLGLTLMCGVVAGEEASWGQHFFGWDTPDSWGQLNDQNETNLHNVSSWADQKPRLLVELGVVMCGIVLPVAAQWGRKPLSKRWRFLVLPLCCLPAAVLAEISHALDYAPAQVGALVWSGVSPAERIAGTLLLSVLCTVHGRLAEPAADVPRPNGGR